MSTVMEGGLPLEQISMRELIAAAEGAPRFHATFTPHDLRTRISPEAPRKIGQLRISDGSEAFIIFNRFAGGDEWDPETEDYTDAVWETAIFRSGNVDEFASPATEPFEDGGDPIIFAVTGALAYTRSVNGHACEFLIELELSGVSGDWRVMRSSSPQSFTLAKHESQS